MGKEEENAGIHFRCNSWFSLEGTCSTFLWILIYLKGKKRSCVVVSNSNFTQVTKFGRVLPITNRAKRYPTDISLVTVDNVITGIVDCTQIRALNLNTRPYKIVDKLDKSIINNIKDVLSSIIK